MCLADPQEVICGPNVLIRAFQPGESMALKNPVINEIADCVGVVNTV